MKPRRASRAPAPTFDLLCDRRRLRVCNPATGARFTVSLRDWEATLWAVRVHPARGQRHVRNAYTTAHRLMARARIEAWLADLRLA